MDPKLPEVDEPSFVVPVSDTIDEVYVPELPEEVLPEPSYLGVVDIADGLPMYTEPILKSLLDPSPRNNFY